MKWCSGCSKEKPNEEFYAKASRCKECCREQAKEAYARKRDSDPEFLAKERVRTRERYYRLDQNTQNRERYNKKKTLGLVKRRTYKQDKQKRWYRTYVDRYPERETCRRLIKDYPKRATTTIIGLII